MGTPLHTCLISLNLLSHPVLSALRRQGSCLSPELKRSQLAAGPSPIVPPSSGITSLLPSDSLRFSSPNLKLIFSPQLSVNCLFINYFRPCTCYFLSLIQRVEVCPASKMTVNFLKTTKCLWRSVCCFTSTWASKLCASLCLSSLFSPCPLFSLRLHCAGPSTILGPLSPGCRCFIPDVFDLELRPPGDLVSLCLMNSRIRSGHCRKCPFTHEAHSRKLSMSDMFSPIGNKYCLV